MVEEIFLDLSEDELLRLSQTRTLALTAEEMQTIARYISSSKTLKLRASKGLTNRITDVELECLAQTWSEHCKHKIFNATIAYEENGRTRKIKSLFATYIKGATAKIRKELGTNDICVSVVPRTMPGSYGSMRSTTLSAGGNPQFTLGAGSLRRGPDRHRGRKP